MFNATELHIIESVSHYGDMADVGAKYDKQVLSAVYSLQAKGFINVYHDLQVSATQEGIAALAEYHQGLKDASKQEAADRENKRQEDLKNAKRDIARFLVDKIIK